MAYQRDYNINTRIVRIFNSYGSRMKLKNGCSIPVFFSQALNNQPAIVFSDGNQTYSFIYIYDQLDGILNLLFSDGKEPVNIGNSEEITVKKMAGEIISLTNSKTKIVYEPLPIDNSQVRHPDISRVKRVLGWEPKIHRSEGLKCTLEYFLEKVEE